MQKRIILLVVFSSAVILLSLGIASHMIVRNSIERSLESRMAISDIIGKNIDYVLESNLTRLQDISLTYKVDFREDDWEDEKKALKLAYEYSIFSDGVFLMDLDGNVVLTYPYREDSRLNLLSIPYVGRSIEGRRPVISDVYTIEPTKRKVIYAFVPLKNADGDVIGVAGGEINPANYLFTKIIKTIPSGDDTRVELIDSHGIIISSNDPQRILTYVDHNQFLGNLIAEKKSFVGACYRCHPESPAGERVKDVLSFAPLSMAPWGVCVRQPQALVFSPSSELKMVFTVLGGIYILTSLILALGLSKSIVRPVRSLIEASQLIGRGNLSEPVEVTCKDEIGTLARSIDGMRVRLAESLERIRQHSDDLEERVRQRTSELNDRKKQLATLLNEFMHAEEEERKRVARELHDETSQSIAAMGMSLEVASVALENGKLTPEMLFDQRRKVGQLLDGINRIIQDLRPPVLDDLGLVSAVRWLLERHLEEKGIAYTLSTSGSFGPEGDSSGCGMDEKTELRIFRLVQEAIINIYKHARASNVYVSMSCDTSRLRIEIVDDGVGFDVRRLFREAAAGEDSSFGLLGMTERVAHLEGRLDIDSEPGKGTRITVEIPLISSLGVLHA